MVTRITMFTRLVAMVTTLVAMPILLNLLKILQFATLVPVAGVRGSVYHDRSKSKCQIHVKIKFSEKRQVRIRS